MQSVHSVLDFDGVVWTAARRIFAEPGGVAKDFVEGRRASVPHPVRMFFLSSLAFFTVIATVGRDQVGMIFVFVAGIPQGFGGDWAPWVILLITVPLLALVLRLLFLADRYRYLEHLVATLEFFSVAFLVAGLEAGLAAAGGGSDAVRLGLFAVSGPYLLMYGALLIRRFYEVSLLAASLRMLALALCYLAGVSYFLVQIGRSVGPTAR